MQNSIEIATKRAPENPYRYVEARGRVREIAQEGADAHIDGMAEKYLGKDVYPNRRPGEQRVLYKIKIERARAMGQASRSERRSGPAHRTLRAIQGR